ncbi:transmembrane protease serine 6-like isoform X2 [Pristis pectinata]|uniref:transmembrane protease serine 6-like isoform X2 n=1 Tax=Pristis pectinata TaxID=685728 RepID=UPI00223CA8BA|nr:transmembrane protease serine 6-like isoform X2 [Pristis pectinata]
MSSVNIEAAKTEEVKTRVPTTRVLKILAIISASLFVLIAAALVAFVLVFYLSHKCMDSEACRGSDYTACGCGQQKTRSERIVGGLSTYDGEWPFMASVQYNGQHICGATLISCRWLLTAAHCFRDRDTDNWTVVLGVHFLDRSTNGIQIRKIAKIIIHPLATPSFNYDVALLELSQPVEYTDFVQPACLPIATASTAGRRCTAIGWGKTSENGLPSNELLQTEVQVFNNSQCQRFIPKITEQMICAGVPEGGRDACQGDSGGPLLCQDENSRAWIVTGVVSFGTGCGRPNYPDKETSRSCGGFHCGKLVW